MAVWRITTVQYNYHVTIENKYYSCPFEYIRKKMDVRSTRYVVEIVYLSTRITSHTSLNEGMDFYHTKPEYMPPEHQKYLTWNDDRFRKWGRNIGENTFTVVDVFLTNPKVEQQGYKACMALLNLFDKYAYQQKLEVD